MALMSTLKLADSSKVGCGVERRTEHWVDISQYDVIRGVSQRHVQVTSRIVADSITYAYVRTW